MRKNKNIIFRRKKNNSSEKMMPVRLENDQKLV
jgi:hypothetical protein